MSTKLARKNIFRGITNGVSTVLCRNLSCVHQLSDTVVNELDDGKDNVS